MPPQRSRIFRIEKTIMAVLLAAAVVMAVAAVAGKYGLLTYMQLKGRCESMQEEVIRLKEENRRLKKEIEALKTDPEAIERVAREELGMIKPGEVLYRLTGKGEPDKERKAP